MTPVEEPAAAPPTPQGPTSPKVSSTIPRRPNLESREGFWSLGPLEEEVLDRAQLPTSKLEMRMRL